jgi:hypothetical protein
MLASSGTGEPTSLHEALQDPNWVEAEHTALLRNKT